MGQNFLFLCGSINFAMLKKTDKGKHPMLISNTNSVFLIFQNSIEYTHRLIRIPKLYGTNQNIIIPNSGKSIVLKNATEQKIVSMPTHYPKGNKNI